MRSRPTVASGEMPAIAFRIARVMSIADGMLPMTDAELLRFGYVRMAIAAITALAQEIDQ